MALCRLASRVQSERKISATLGQEAIDRSIIAGIVGLSLVILFMIVYYRLPGVLASFALVIYAAVAYSLFKLVPVTLTLAGIAGFILSIGMAVDANVLIFSRLKEELRSGKTLGAAVEAGFDHAWPSIRDFERINAYHLRHTVLVWLDLWRSKHHQRFRLDPGYWRNCVAVHCY